MCTRAACSSFSAAVARAHLELQVSIHVLRSAALPAWPMGAGHRRSSFRMRGGERPAGASTSADPERRGRWTCPSHANGLAVSPGVPSADGMRMACKRTLLHSPFSSLNSPFPILRSPFSGSCCRRRRAKPTFGMRIGVRFLGRCVGSASKAPRPKLPGVGTLSLFATRGKSERTNNVRGGDETLHTYSPGTALPRTPLPCTLLLRRRRRRRTTAHIDIERDGAHDMGEGAIRLRCSCNCNCNPLQHGHQTCTPPPLIAARRRASAYLASKTFGILALSLPVAATQSEPTAAGGGRVDAPEEDGGWFVSRWNVDGKKSVARNGSQSIHPSIHPIPSPSPPVPSVTLPPALNSCPPPPSSPLIKPRLVPTRFSSLPSFFSFFVSSSSSSSPPPQQHCRVSGRCRCSSCIYIHKYIPSAGSSYIVRRSISSTRKAPLLIHR